MMKNRTLMLVLLGGFLSLAGISIASAEGEIRGIVHLQDTGDTYLQEGTWVGTRGESRRLEGFSLELFGLRGVWLEYMCHLQTTGDTDWMAEGEFCGTRDQGLRLEGFAVRLAGPRSDQFTVEYRCHLEDLADQLALDGGFCGSRDEARRLEAMHIMIERN